MSIAAPHDLDAYFRAQGMEYAEFDTETLTAVPNLCTECGRWLVPWFDICDPFLGVDPCQHADPHHRYTWTDPHGWSHTACLDCGEVMSSDDNGRGE